MRACGLYRVMPLRHMDQVVRHRQDLRAHDATVPDLMHESKSRDLEEFLLAADLRD